jgi:capsular polysaccharide biosynthesis protein
MDNKNFIKGDEIDLTDLVKVVWSGRWFIVKVTGVFAAIGLLIAFTSPKEYDATCTLIPEAIGAEGKIGGSLGGLASLAGIDLGGLTGDAAATINPGLYRSVAQSTPFLLELMNQEFYFYELDEKVSLFDYYMLHQRTGLISKIFSLPLQLLSGLKSEAEIREIPNSELVIIALSKDQQSMIEDLIERILVTMDWELNLVIIEVEMQDPVVAAQIANYTQEYITEYVIHYSVSKSKEQYAFVSRQYDERKLAFEKAQTNLAKIRDENRNVNTSLARSEEERLHAEYNLAFGIYDQLAKQKEALKLQINERTPIFTILEPVKIPVEKSKPRRLIILIISLFVGVIFASTATVARQLLKS